MKIIKISRNKLYLERYGEEEIIDVSPDIIYEMKLNKLEKLSEGQYERVIYLASLSKGIFLLSRRDYTKKEMITKLNLKFKSYQMVEEAVEKLVERGYIDDLSYAKSLIERTHDSKRKIEYKLKLKGISTEVIREAFLSGEHNELEEIKRLLKKISRKERNKQIEYLMRKGFRYEDIKNALED